MSASRVGKWRYRVPAPTPASLAMSSRLAFAPDRVNASLATSRMRSRLRCASVRGLRRTGCERFLAIRQKYLQPEKVSGYLIYCFGDTLRFIEVIGGSSIAANTQGGRQWWKYLERPQQQTTFYPA